MPTLLVLKSADPELGSSVPPSDLLDRLIERMEAEGWTVKTAEPRDDLPFDNYVCGNDATPDLGKISRSLIANVSSRSRGEGEALLTYLHVFESGLWAAQWRY